MEKRLRLKRCNPLLSRESQDDAPCIVIRAPDRELAAKDMLFELSDNESAQQDETPCINQWFTPDPEPHPHFSSVTRLNSQHRSLYLARNAHSKIRTQTSQERHLELSVIPHLKSHLRKLESPEKPPTLKRKERRAQQSTVPDENFQLHIFQTAQATPHCASRPKDTSIYKKTKKSIFIHSTTEGKARNIVSRERTCCEIRDITERLEVIKEARRNRTLRKLLF